LECIASLGETVAMIKAAVDESGTHDNRALLCVAFCLATSTQWRHFEREWSAVRILPPGVKHYHAKDRRCDDLTAKLIPLMERRMSRMVAVTLREPDYRAVASPRLLGFIGGGYAMAVQFGIYKIHDWLWEQGQRIAYVLESGHKGEGAVQRFLSVLSNSHDLRRRARYVSHAWLPKGEPILDPADLVSHEISTCDGEISERVQRLTKRLAIHHMTAEEFHVARDAIEDGFRNQRHERLARKRSQCGPDQ
jgi:hypothetical protein